MLLNLYICIYGAGVSTVAPCRRILGSIPGQDVSVRSFHVLHKYSGLLHSPKTCQLGVSRLMGHSKLTVGVNMSVDGCLCLYVSALWWTGNMPRVLEYGWMVFTYNIYYITLSCIGREISLPEVFLFSAAQGSWTYPHLIRASKKMPHLFSETKCDCCLRAIDWIVVVCTEWSELVRKL